MWDFIEKLTKNTDEIKTNVDAMVGKIGIVTKTIDSLHQSGQVKIDGETWSALGENEMNIEKGTQIIVKDIKGVKVVVAPRTKDK